MTLRDFLLAAFIIGVLAWCGAGWVG